MAQLRDARTSELIAEGDPLELVLLADELGRDEVLFDDVGAHFNPDAVLEAHRENVDGLAGAVKVAKTAERDVVRKAHAHAKARLELEPARISEATAALEAAREKLEG